MFGILCRGNNCSRVSAVRKNQFFCKSLKSVKRNTGSANHKNNKENRLLSKNQNNKNRHLTKKNDVCK